MTKKEKTDFIISVSLLIEACIILLLPSFNITNVLLVLIIVMASFAFLKLLQFILTFKDKDYQSLFMSIISLISCLVLAIFELDKKIILLIFLIWMGLTCLVKLKKADYYHDRDNKLWVFRIIVLLIFLTIGLLTGLNLYQSDSLEILLFGYFFFINACLEMLDPMILYLVGKNNESSK